MLWETDYFYVMAGEMAGPSESLSSLIYTIQCNLMKVIFSPSSHWCSWSASRLSQSLTEAWFFLPRMRWRTNVLFSQTVLTLLWLLESNGLGKWYCCTWKGWIKSVNNYTRDSKKPHWLSVAGSKRVLKRKKIYTNQLYHSLLDKNYI